MSVTHEGNRRSESKTDPIARELHPEEDPRWPGYHTVIVPKRTNAHGRLSHSIGTYKGWGYEIISENPEHCHDEDHVLMGIPLQKYLDREEARLAEHNEMLGAIDDEAFTGLPTSPQELAKIPADNPLQTFIDEQRSGLVRRKKASIEDVVGELKEGPDVAGIE